MKRKHLCNVFLVISILLVGCSQEKEKKDIESILVTAKYCYNSYPPSHYFEGSDSIGVNFYFAGQLFNNTTDTFYMPDRELKFTKMYDIPLKETLYYTLINEDSLFFWSWAPAERISPNSSIMLNLQYYITPDSPQLLAIFKNIAKDQTILDTMKICYATPNMQLKNGGKLLPPIELGRSNKFRIDSVAYNSYFEQIFKGSEYYENPPIDYDAIKID